MLTKFVILTDTIAKICIANSSWFYKIHMQSQIFPIYYFLSHVLPICMYVQTDYVCKFVALTIPLLYDLLTIATKLAQLIFDTLLVFLIECQGQFLLKFPWVIAVL